ncbi:MAG: 5-formyltetrahydrofolate cyclo-ligase [Bacteroidales bacterium]
MISIQQQKRLLRAEIRQRKAEIPFEEKKIISAKIWKELEELEIFKKAKCILFYWSMSDEVHTHDFIDSCVSEKKIILPSVDGDRLLLRQYRGKQDLIPGDIYRIPEPSGPVFKEIDKIDLIVVPGVAFDSEGNRMGRGRAYYDKLLRSKTCPKIGVGFKIQILDEIPHDELDVKMDIIIHE